ncbi:hypothetical protein lerEdw1_019265 [Lerista edwardsae]|nr:hypothetical protein lerEdw1_019265 [Lerista edwardsae]
MTEPLLLRKPLPPKVETELHISKRKDYKEDLGAYDEAKKSREKDKGASALLPVPPKSSPNYLSGIHLGNQDLPPSYPPIPDIKRAVIIPPQLSGPPSFPSLKQYSPLRMRFLKLKRFPLRMAAEFALKGSATRDPLYLPMMQLVPFKPILSRCNYEIITSQLIAAETRGTQHISTVLVSFGGKFHDVPEPRKPYRQLLIEPKEKGKGKGKAGVGVRESLVSGVPCKPQLTEEDEEKEVMTRAEMAVLFCLLHRRTGLSLKAYFLSQLPGLSSLADFLVYLNLSFNCLSVFPKEVFDLKHLEILKLRNNPIRFIPEEIKQMQSLKVLIMSFNLLTALPVGLFELANLEGLDVSYNELEEIPNAIGNLSHLTYLNLEGNFLYVLPCGILKVPLNQLKVENNFLHNYFWGEIRQLQIQRLTDLAALCFAQNDLWKMNKWIPKAIKEILDNYTSCSCCQGYLYGEGWRFIRIYRNAYGLRLPYLFEACSPTCYANFISQTDPT